MYGLNNFRNLSAKIVIDVTLINSEGAFNIWINKHVNKYNSNIVSTHPNEERQSVRLSVAQISDNALPLPMFQLAVEAPAK